MPAQHFSCKSVVVSINSEKIRIGWNYCISCSLGETWNSKYFKTKKILHTLHVPECDLVHHPYVVTCLCTDLFQRIRFFIILELNCLRLRFLDCQLFIVLRAPTEYRWEVFLLGISAWSTFMFFARAVLSSVICFGWN